MPGFAVSLFRFSYHLLAFSTTKWLSRRVGSRRNSNHAVGTGVLGLLGGTGVPGLLGGLCTSDPFIFNHKMTQIRRREN